jgi:lysophospholipase L1-like esterase
MAEPLEHQASSESAAAKRPRGHLWAWLGFGIATIAATGLYLHFKYSRAIGSGPAGPTVSGQAFAGAWTTKPVLLVGLGDSVTAGFGARKGYSYFDLLEKNASDDFSDIKGRSLSIVFPNLRSTNLSVSGSTSFESLEAQLPRLATADAQTLGWVVITTGGNDLIHNYGRTPPRPQAMYGASWDQARPWIEDFERRLAAMLTGISARFPGGSHIFLANIYDPTDGQGDIQCAGLPAWPDGARILAAYNEAISRCCERRRNAHLVNLRDLFLGHGIHCGEFWAKHYCSKDPHYWYYSNLEDPNERGYDAIRRQFLLEMAKQAAQLP